MKNTIITGGTYTSQIERGSSPFKNFAYTSEYVSSKTNANDWKTLCQRYADIGQLLTDFENILSSMSTGSQKTQFTDQLDHIKQIYQQNNMLRKNLEYKLNDVIKGEYYNDSKQFLDSTIYVSVLWTILATTLVFYVFKKM